MRRLYLFHFAPPATRESVREALNAMPEVLAWRFDMPNLFYVISDNTAREIASAYRSVRRDEGRFLVAAIDPQNRQGWLPADTWYLLNNLALTKKSK